MKEVFVLTNPQKQKPWHMRKYRGQAGGGGRSWARAFAVVFVGGMSEAGQTGLGLGGLKGSRLSAVIWYLALG